MIQQKGLIEIGIGVGVMVIVLVALFSGTVSLKE